MTTSDRFQYYFTAAESVLNTYKDKEIGAQILGQFYIDDDGKPDWDPSIRKYYNKLRQIGESTWETWQLKGGKEYFTAKEIATLSTRMKVMTFVGSKIYECIHKADTLANTHLNKHWPRELKSGQSPGGRFTMFLLYVIT